jgi:D-xylose transport system substrate-binding protein
VSTRRGIRVAAVAAAALAAVAIAACGDDNNDDSSTSGSSGGGGGGSGSIALLLPESQTARYESQDRPLFEKKVKQLCSGCDILYSNADQDATKQQQQAEAALTKGAKVLVLDPVDAGSAGAIVAKAKQMNVPVISYDRLITKADIDYYISFDNVEVGKLQGKSLVDELAKKGKASGTIFMINGDPADNNAKLFKQGAHSVIDKSKLKVGKEYDTPGWSGSKAQTEADQAITALGKNGFVGAYGANDDMAAGAIAAMKGSGIKPADRPTTGQDAALAGIQRILIGEQFMTVYKAYKPEAEKAAEIAVALVQGKKPRTGLVTEMVDNEMKKVPSVILTPVAVVKNNIEDTVVKDGLWSPSQICTKAYASACKEAGIQ